MSDPNETIRNLTAAHRTSTEKHTYFLLAAAGAAIAYAVEKSEGARLELLQIPLALAALSWTASFYCGCMHLVLGQAAMFLNAQWLQLTQGFHPQQPSNPAATQALVQEAWETLRRQIERSRWYGMTQFFLIVAGAVLFIVWRVLTMARAASLL